MEEFEKLVAESFQSDLLPVPEERFAEPIAVVAQQQQAEPVAEEVETSTGSSTE
jgi:hypothetical protein